MATMSADIPDPIRLELSYGLTQRGIEDFVAEKAADPPERFTLEIDFSELDKDLRRRAYKIYERQTKFDPEIPPLVELLWPKFPALDAYTDDPATVIAAWEAYYVARTAAWEKAEEDARLKTSILQGKRVAFEIEMGHWIRAKGSEQLKLGLDRGYKIATTYLRERAAIEFPGFSVDTGGKAKWQERANPTLKALKREGEALESQLAMGTSYKIRIVWLVKEMNSSDAKKREVIVVPEYLQLYTLISEIGEGTFDPDEIPF